MCSWWKWKGISLFYFYCVCVCGGVVVTGVGGRGGIIVGSASSWPWRVSGVRCVISSAEAGVVPVWFMLLSLGPGIQWAFSKCVLEIWLCTSDCFAYTASEQLPKATCTVQLVQVGLPNFTLEMFWRLLLPEWKFRFHEPQGHPYCKSETAFYTIVSRVGSPTILSRCGVRSGSLPDSFILYPLSGFTFPHSLRSVPCIVLMNPEISGN